jgi:hypothetical protein
MTNCTIENCSEKPYANGMCKKHYKKQYNIDNKDKIREQQRQYDLFHKDEIKKRKQIYYIDNKEEIGDRQKEYVINHKDKRREYTQQYYINNKEEMNNESKEYALIHKDEIKKYAKQYYLDNREEILKATKSYYQNNKPKVRKNANNRRKLDIPFRLRRGIASVVRSALKNNGFSKNGKSITKYLPYSFQQLKEHIEQQFEPWMTWNNWSVYDKDIWNDNNSSTWTWQLDHIIPQSKLPYINMEDDNFKKCWALENLRPYSAKQNIIDGKRR